MKKLWANFKKLIMRGNIVDLAIGVMLGTAFTSITKSLANDVLMPPISHLLSGVHFSELKYVIAEATEETKEVAILYGNFIQTIVDFLIIAFSVCLFATVLNHLQASTKENLETGKKHIRRIRRKMMSKEDLAKLEAEEVAAKAEAEKAEAEAKAKAEEAEALAAAKEALAKHAQETQMEQTELLREILAQLKAKA